MPLIISQEQEVKHEIAGNAVSIVFTIRLSRLSEALAVVLHSLFNRDQFVYICWPRLSLRTV